MLRLIRAVLIAGVLLPIAGLAQTPAAPAMPPTPTTKVMAIGRITGPFPPDQRRGIMPGEVADTVRLYLAGKIDQWYSREDQPGVVFIMNVSSVDEARELLSKLPLGKAKIMEFELIPLGPLSPLRILLNEPAAASHP